MGRRGFWFSVVVIGLLSVAHVTSGAPGDWSLGSQLPALNSALSTLLGGNGLDLPGLSQLSSFGSVLQAAVKKKLAMGAVVAMKNTTFWGDLTTLLNHTDTLFSSTPDAPPLLDLTDGMSNETQEALRVLWTGVQELEEEFCTPASYTPPALVPTRCTGHNVTISISGGFCIFRKDHSVICRKPSVRLIKTPPTCKFKHHTSGVVKCKECKFEKEWGTKKNGTLIPHHGPKHYNLTKIWHDSRLTAHVAAAVDHLEGVVEARTQTARSRLDQALQPVTQAIDAVRTAVSNGAASLVSWYNQNFGLHWGRG